MNRFHRRPFGFRLGFGLGLALVALFTSAGCASGQTVEEQEAERRDAWVLTRLVSPRDVQIQELRIRDVDTDSFHSMGGLPGEPLLIRVKAGRYRFKTLKATIPGGKKPKFEQPDKALEILGCCINYIGDVVISSRREKYRLYIDARPQTVIDAAQLYPEAFAGKSVVLVLGDEKTRKLVFEGEDGEPLFGLEASTRSED